MRRDDAPQHDCPDCDDHPPLVYEDSVGPAGFIGPGGRAEGGVMHHYYRCAVCGRKYRAADGGGPTATPPNQNSSPPAKTCPNCGSAMRVGKIAVGPAPPSGPRPFGGSYSRVETTLAWRCDKCGATDDFKHADVLGFN